PNTNLKYDDMLYAQIDVVCAGIKALGHTDVQVRISETGWPSNGDVDEPEATVEDAGIYNRNLLQMMQQGQGTPAHPSQPLSLAFLQRVIASLHGEFVVTDLGSLTYFLGISAQRSFTGLFLSQSTYADEIRERAHMQEYNSCRTHVDTESKLGADGEPLTVQAAPMSTSTSQPTCLSDASTLAGFFPVQLVRSTSGYCVFLDDNLFSWSANRQVTFSRSSVKAEYIGVANVVAEAGWVTQ
ncbi:ribonuclease H-like domain-containing protein, partial [Tanacetum coccineum]